MWACEGRDFEDGEDSESRIKVALPAKSGRPPESARLVPHKLGRGIRGTGYRKVGANALPTGPNSCGFDTGVRVFFHSPAFCTTSRSAPFARGSLCGNNGIAQ